MRLDLVEEETGTLGRLVLRGWEGHAAATALVIGFLAVAVAELIFRRPSAGGLVVTALVVLLMMALWVLSTGRWCVDVIRARSYWSQRLASLVHEMGTAEP